MIVDNKTTFQYWFVHNEFDKQNVTFSNNSKNYINNLLKNNNLPPTVSLQPPVKEETKEESKKEIKEGGDY